MPRKRQNPEASKKQIAAAAYELAKQTGISGFTKEEVATKAGVSRPLVSHYYSTMTQLKRDVMRMACREGHTQLIAEGIVLKFPSALALPEEKRKEALNSLV